MVNVLTSILNEQLTAFLDEFNVLQENQTGFLKKVFKAYCLFVDFEKAFDNVWQKALWFTLIQ